MQFIFSSLTSYQAEFFAAVGRHLQAEGHAVAHLLFHEPAARELAEAGETVVNVFAEADRVTAPPELSDYGIDNPALLLSHEKVFYDLRESRVLEEKLRRFLGGVDAALDRLLGDRPAIFVQELGGFCSVIAGYYAARRRGLRHLFLEPSFFKGRLFAPADGFAAARIDPATATGPGPEVQAYIDQALEQRHLVIPTKDRRHYRGVLAKLADPYNWRRLSEKLWQKHVRGEREEFSHIGTHVRRHLRMYVTARKLRHRYASLQRLSEKGQPFVYYPLHVPTDFALTVRSPAYLDQYALIDYLCRNLPAGHLVAIKEHPALIGAVDSARMEELFRRHDRLVLLEPDSNNYAVMQAAATIVTVNSKSGAEATLLGRPVLVLGDAFYRGSPLAISLERLEDLPAALRAAVADWTPPSRAEVGAYFQAVWNATFEGELFDMRPHNVAAFARSLLQTSGALTTERRVAQA